MGAFDTLRKPPKPVGTAAPVAPPAPKAAPQKKSGFFDTLRKPPQATPAPAPVVVAPKPAAPIVVPSAPVTPSKPVAVGPRRSLVTPIVPEVPQTIIRAPDPNQPVGPIPPKTSRASLDLMLSNAMEADAIKTDKPLQAIKQKAVSTAGHALNTFIEGIRGVTQQANEAEKLRMSPDPQKKLAGALASGAVVANTIFTPLNSAMDAVRVLPEGDKIKKNLIDRGFEVANTAIMEGTGLAIGAAEKATGGEIDPDLEQKTKEAVALFVMLGLASKSVKGVKEFNLRRVATNDIVRAAQEQLGIQSSKNVIGQIKKVDPNLIASEYRRAAQSAHPDKGGTANEFQVITTARDILNDYNNLTPTQFRSKYQTPLEGIQKQIAQIPEKTGEAAPKVSGPELPAVASAAPEAPVRPFDGLRKQSEALVTPEKRFEMKDGKMVEIAPKPVAEPQISPKTTALEPTVPTPKPVETIKPTQKPTNLPKKAEIAEIDALSKYAQEQAKTGAGSDAILAGKLAKGEAMKIAAIKRGLEGTTTPTEKAAARKYLTSNYVGKSVTVNGVPGKVTRSSFGRVGVKFENGIERYVASKEIKADAVSAKEVNAYLRDKAETAFKAQKLRYPNFKAPEIKPVEAAPKTRSEPAPKVEAPVTQQTLPFERIKTEPTNVQPATSAPKTELPMKKSSVGKSIEAKAIERGLTESLGSTAEFQTINIKDQAERVAELLNTDPERAARIIRAEEKIPDGIHPVALIKAMEDYALSTKNVKLIQEIANSPLTAETSFYAQGMRLLAERDPDSAVAALQKLKKAKEAAAEKRVKVNKEKTVSEIKEKIKKEPRPKATKETWSSFIDSIVCK